MLGAPTSNIPRLTTKVFIIFPPDLRVSRQPLGSLHFEPLPLALSFPFYLQSPPFFISQDPFPELRRHQNGGLRGRVGWGRGSHWGPRQGFPHAPPAFPSPTPRPPHTHCPEPTWAYPSPRSPPLNSPARRAAATLGLQTCRQGGMGATQRGDQYRTPSSACTPTAHPFPPPTATSSPSPSMLSRARSSTGLCQPPSRPFPETPAIPARKQGRPFPGRSRGSRCHAQSRGAAAPSCSALRRTGRLWP